MSYYRLLLMVVPHLLIPFVACLPAYLPGCVFVCQPDYFPTCLLAYLSRCLTLYLPALFYHYYSMSAAGRIGTADLVDRTYRFVKKVREDEEAAAPKVFVPKSTDSDLIEEEDSVYP